eukprot:SAG11_NODE_3079_length_2709_cov_1.445594_3_plen_83_part_00
MEEKSFAEQIAAVRQADVLMGVHGAGLTHGLWLKRGAAVRVMPQHSSLPWESSMRYAVLLEKACYRVFNQSVIAAGATSFWS